jgi:hypothetical protein
VVVLKKAVVLMQICYLRSTSTDTFFFIIVPFLVLGLKNPTFPGLQASSIDPNTGRKPNAIQPMDSDISIQ